LQEKKQEQAEAHKSKRKNDKKGKNDGWSDKKLKNYLLHGLDHNFLIYCKMY